MNVFRSKYFVGLWKLQINQHDPGYCITLLIKGILYDTVSHETIYGAIEEANILIHKYGSIL